MLIESPSLCVYRRQAKQPAGISMSSSAIYVVAAGIDAWPWNSSHVERRRCGSVRRAPSGVSRQNS